MRLIFSLFFFTLYFLFCTGCFANSYKVPKTQLTADHSNQLHTTSGTYITLNQTEIKQTGAKNLSEILQHVASIYIYSSDGNMDAPGISMRGFGGNGAENTLVLLNGFPLRNPDMNNAYFNLIPVTEIQKIEILPESGGALYGGDAVGGIINIITKTPEKFTAGASLGAGSYRGNSQSVHLGNKIGHFHYFLLAKKSRTDNNRAHNNSNVASGMAEVGYQNSKTSLDFQTQNTYQNSQYPGSLQSPSNSNYQAVHLYLYQLNLKHHFNNNWQLKSLITKRLTNTWGSLSGPFTQNRNILSIMPRIIGILPLDNILTTSGIDYEKTIYHLNSAPYPSLNKANTANTQSLYTHWQIPLEKQWSLVLGGRYAKMNNTLNDAPHSNHAFVTEQSLIYNPSKNWRYYIRRAGSYRFPRADETGQNDTQLKTQTGVSYELGTRLQKQGLQVNLEAYMINLKNEIAYALAYPNDPNYAQNRNLDPTRRLGFLINSTLRITQKFTLMTNLNLVQARYSKGPFKNKTIPMAPEKLAKLAGLYQISTRWSAYLAALYTSDMYPAGDDANQAAIGGFVTWNTNLRYKLNRWSASFRVNNLFGKRYNLYTNFMAGPNSLILYPAPGRNYWLTVSYDIN